VTHGRQQQDEGIGFVGFAIKGFQQVIDRNPRQQSDTARVEYFELSLQRGAHSEDLIHRQNGGIYYKMAKSGGKAGISFEGNGFDRH
jgi:hypothetical protein